MSNTISKPTSPRDVFLQLLAIITLYMSAVAFGMLLFQMINIYIPDPLSDAYGHALSYKDPLRWAVASLVVVFPVYVWVSAYVEREAGRVPEKRELKTRRWLLNFTLFAAAVIIIGDLVSLIYNFLQGDLTLRFVLKIASVIVIAALVFGYYLWLLRRQARTDAETTPHPSPLPPGGEGGVQTVAESARMAWFVRAVIAVVGVATIAGFFVAGLPKSQRLIRFDERRVNHLQNMQWQIVNFWEKKDRLPSTLDELKDDIGGYIPPRDPQNGAPYEYRGLAPLQFELCATFSLPSDATRSKYALPVGLFPEGAWNIDDTWDHEAGRVCFTRTIDPERYRPVGKEPRPAPGD